MVTSLAQRSVALVGRPNVGKSRLFNRLAGRRIAIVHDQAGVTRDVVATEIDNDFVLMDTGGIGIVPEMTTADLHAATEEQVDFALMAAGMILFVCDGKEGMTALDRELADKLRRTGKPVVLVVNKLDREERQDEQLTDFYTLGFADVLAVSAEHGHGVKELRAALFRHLGPAPSKDESADGQTRVRICFAGRPNVGKSSLCNRLLKSSRLVVSDVPGTTRDTVQADLDYTPPENEDETWHFRLYDTAGVRARGKVNSSVEFFSGLRSREAMAASDVVFLVLDAMEGVTRMDKKIAGEVMESGAGLVIVINKWDRAREAFASGGIEGYENEGEFRRAFRQAVRKELFFLPESPVLFVSALEGIRMDEILAAGREVDHLSRQHLPTGALNRVMEELMEARPARVLKRKRFKAYYSVQVGNKPYRIRVFGNSEERFEDNYGRYLEAGVRKAFDLRGCPVRFEIVGKEKRYAEKSAAE